MTVAITLTPDQERFLEAEVAAGHFPSVEAAVRAAVQCLLPSDEGDVDWVKPYLDEAREGVARGEVVPLNEVQSALAERINRLQGGQ